MPKNIVVFSDGTGQDGGVRPDQRVSNIYKLYRATRVDALNGIDPSKQLAFYDPGLGTDDDVHGFGRIWRTVQKMLGSVAGRGIGVNITDCYEFILNHWEPGDRIYIFGFSRGAYTARCVAQVISLCGVPQHETGDPATPFRRFARSTRLAALRAVHQVYEHGAGHPRGQFEAERDEQARRYRVDYGSDADGSPNASPYLIGVFDTVAALGAKGWKYYGIAALLTLAAAVPVAIVAALIHWVSAISFWKALAGLVVTAGLGTWLKLKRDSLRWIDDFPDKGSPRRRHWISWHASNYDRGLSGHVGFARHASAIDEDRADFPRVGWGRHDVIRKPVEGEPPPLVQLWFAGDHSDIGGSYPETESRLSDISLGWMVEEAETLPHPLIIDRSKLSVWPDPAAMQHSEVVSVRDRTLWWMPRWAPAWLRNGWSSAIRQSAGSPVHPSVYARFALDSVQLPTGQGAYRPEGLRDDPRFAHFYSGADPVDEETLSAARDAFYRIGSEHHVDWSPGDPTAEIMALFEAGLHSQGVLISITPWRNGESDAYRDALSLRCLESRLQTLGLNSVHADCRQRSDPLFSSTALLVPGADGETGSQLARSIGQTVFIEFGQDGTAYLRSAGKGA
jgi:hypothetical protein